MFKQGLVRRAVLLTHGACVNKGVWEMFALNVVPDISPGPVAEMRAETTGQVASSRVFDNVLEQICWVKA